MNENKRKTVEQFVDKNSNDYRHYLMILKSEADSHLNTLVGEFEKLNNQQQTKALKTLEIGY